MMVVILTISDLYEHVCFSIFGTWSMWYRETVPVSVFRNLYSSIMALWWYSWLWW